LVCQYGCCRQTGVAARVQHVPIGGHDRRRTRPWFTQFNGALPVVSSERRPEAGAKAAGDSSPPD
jgi:hypothetical protein